MTHEMYRLRNREGHEPVKRLGRKSIYVDREVVQVSLPSKAIEKIEELRGKQLRGTFLTEFICENLGLQEEDIYVKC